MTKEVIDLSLYEFDFKLYMKLPIPIKAIQIKIPFKVETLEGVMKGKAYDYLLVGINGERYPCDKEIFEKSYRLIDECST